MVILIIKIIGYKTLTNVIDLALVFHAKFTNSETKGFCLVHFINNGVTVDGNNATVEFIGTGEFDTFNCNLDRKGFEPCEEVQLILIL